jgi:hypothetical protein
MDVLYSTSIEFQNLQLFLSEYIYMEVAVHAKVVGGNR